MLTILFGLHALFLITDTAAIGSPQAEPFEYEIALEVRPATKSLMAFRTQAQILRFKVESVKKVPGSAPIHIIKTAVKDSFGVVEIITVKDSIFTPNKPEFPAERGESSFYVEVKSVQFNLQNFATLRLRFKDRDEVYTLHCKNGDGLWLEAADCKFGKITAEHFPEFVNIRATEGARNYQCNPLTISAIENEKSLWSTEIGMLGQPDSISVLERVLFVKTTGGHSFYVMKDTGEMLLYDGSVMKGGNPSDDLLTTWRRDMGLTFAEREKRGFLRFIIAAVMLNERKSIPLMIECVEHGFGLDEKCAAIAALEKFNGNPKLWPEKFPTPPSYFLKTVGMSKVIPAANAQAERKKWEAIFKDDIP